jgi:hypothetical protein
MKIKSERDFWSGLVFIVVGLGFSWGALNYSFGSSGRPGPGYFPFGLGILLALLGAFTLFESLTIDTEDGEKLGRFPFKQLFIIIGSIALFGVLIPRFGLLISLPILIITSAMAGDEFHWGEVLVMSVVLTAASWAIFIWGLALTVPVMPTIFK